MMRKTIGWVPACVVAVVDLTKEIFDMSTLVADGMTTKYFREHVVACKRLIGPRQAGHKAKTVSHEKVN